VSFHGWEDDQAIGDDRGEKKEKEDGNALMHDGLQG